MCWPPHSAAVCWSAAANVTAHLSGANSAHGAGPLRVESTLQYSGSYSGSGPIPVTATAVVNAPASAPAGLKARQSGSGGTEFVTTTAGAPMTLAFGVE